LRSKPQVPFQLARGHQLGEYELGQDGVAEVLVALGGDDRLAQRRRHEQPADAQRRREDLGHAARVADLLGQGGAQRGHRRPVVAVLGVVVVLDDQAAIAGPLPQLTPPRAVEHHAGGELMRRGES